MERAPFKGTITLQLGEQQVVLSMDVADKVLVDGRIETDPLRGVGLMDVLTVGEDNYRCVLDEKGNFVELDWGADEKPKMDPAKVKQIGITAGLGVVLVSALVMFAMTDHTPKRKQTLVKQEKVEPKYQIGRKAVVDTTHVQTALTFSTDILKINKLVYESIRLILESGAVVDKTKFRFARAALSLNVARILLVRLLPLGVV